MVNFKDDESLGKTVKSTRLFCSIGVEPIKKIDQLRFAAGGNKFSQLCGFLFDSADPKSEYPRFSISFVCKLRSKIYRQQTTNPSQWFIFKKVSNTRVDVLDKKALLANYGFDIDKFFQSDLFKKSLPQFEKTLKKGLAEAKEWASKNIKDRKEADRYIKAIEEAMPLLNASHSVNNKYYELNDLDALSVDAKAKDDAFKAKLDAIGLDNIKQMKKAAKQSDKWLKNDYVYQKLHGKADEAEQLDEVSYDQLDWKDGTVTGKGIEQLVSNTKFVDQPVRVYDRKTKAYYNIVDSHMTKLNGGFGLEIDTSKPVLEKDGEEDVKDTNKVYEADKLDLKNLKPMTVKELLDDVNSWLKDDEAWRKVKLVVNAPDGKTYYVQYSGATEDVPGGAYFFECGKEAKMKKPTHEAEGAEKEEASAEKTVDEATLNKDIEEALEEIYK